MNSPKRIALALALLAALSGCTATAATSTPVPTGSATVANVFAMKVGDCLTDDNSLGGDATVTHVPIVKCSVSHTSEVIASILLKGANAAYPGTDSVNATADQRCNAPYEKFTGATLKTTALDYTFYVPTAGGWKQGDRQILCVVYNPAGPVTGSLKGKGSAYPKS